MPKKHRINYKGYIASLAQYMDGHGLNITPFPKIKLSNRTQEGVFIRTAFYDPGEKTVTLFIKDRHPKDVLRSLAHELVHHNQNLEKRLTGYTGDRIVDDGDGLMPLEKEAYLKGNILFRSWTEEVDRNGIPHKYFGSHMKKKLTDNDLRVDESRDRSLRRLVEGEVRSQLRKNGFIN